MWHLTHADADKDFEYSFTALSCNGSACTVAGLLLNKQTHWISIVFWRSNDGGNTWIIQDPGLPIQRGQSQNQFTSIQQIDSVNVVAIGDTGLIVRTFDGGITWERQQSNTEYILSDVHFSDPLNGIIVCGGIEYQILITSDGGMHWNKAPFPGIGFTRCHSYGNGKFRVFKYGWGAIYSTNDNWQTIDSTLPIYTAGSDPKYKHYLLTSCNFGGGDTVIATGIDYYRDTFPGDGLIIRSVDGGKHWEQPTTFRNSLIDIRYTTPLNHDTVLAGGWGGSKIIVSTAHGSTWKVDSLVLDTNYPVYTPFGLSMTGDGHPIGIFSHAFFKGSTGILARGTLATSKVESYERIIYNTYIYPNPASSEVNIISIDIKRPVYLYDILGREVLKSVTSLQGKVTFDVSRLPIGVYSIVLDHFAKMLPIGKVVKVE